MPFDLNLNTVPLCVPSGILYFTFPSSVGTSNSSPRAAWTNVIGVDYDEVAVNVAGKNIKENNVDDIVEIKHGNLMDMVMEKANIIVANITADIIMLLSKDIKRFLNSCGLFITSGIIIDKTKEVEENLIANGLEVVKVETMGEWSTIVSKIKGE